MNGYVIGGYVVSIGSLVTYGATLAGRERRRRRRRLGVAASHARSGRPLGELVTDDERGFEPPRRERLVSTIEFESPDAATPDDLAQ